MSHHTCTKGSFDDLPLVVNGKAVAAEDGTELPLDVRLVLPVVSYKDCSEVSSARYIMGGDWRETISGSNIASPNTSHGLHLVFTKVLFLGL